MSLGPPFDGSQAQLQARLGGGLLLLLTVLLVGWLAGVGDVLFSRVHLYVQFGHTGSLRPGDRVRLGGRDIGELVSVSPLLEQHAWKGVRFDARIDRDAIMPLPANAVARIAMPTVLSEAYLEIGPPPGEPVGRLVPGATLRGIDPPDLDQLFEHIERSIRAILALLREEPALKEFSSATASLRATLGEMPGDVLQLAANLTLFRRELGLLQTGLRSAGGFEAMARTGSAVARVGRPIGLRAPDLKLKLERIDANLGHVAATFDSSTLGKLTLLVRAGEHTLQRAEKLAQAIDTVANEIDAGRGTMGGFVTDRELVDDLHETHRIIKSEPWQLILKRQRSGEKR